MDEELDLDKGYYSRAELYKMNAEFIAAMAAAIRAGLERPPRVGIDPRPGTKNPTNYVDRRWPLLDGRAGH